MLAEFKKHVISSYKGKNAKAYEAMVQAVDDFIVEQDAHHFDQTLYSDMMATHFELAENRPEGQPQIKIYSPLVDGTSRRKTVIDIVSDDMAFVVDSVAATVNKHRCLIEILIHPVLNTIYTGKSVLKDVLLGEDSKSGVRRQSHIHIHVHEALNDEEAEALKADLLATIEDVRAANKDWKTMLVRLKETSAKLEVSKTERPDDVVHEYCEFLDYLHDNNFTLLGYADYVFGYKGGYTKREGLGLLNDDFDKSVLDETAEGFPFNLQDIDGTLPPITIAKSKVVTRVHRRVPMDVIAVKRYDENGKVVGERIFLGLFTSVTYSRSVRDIPYLRLKVQTIVDMSAHAEGSHDSKALRHILEKYPRDELFQTETKALYATCSKILRLQERQRIALFTRQDVFGHYISCMVYVPRDRFGTALRKRIVKLLEAELGGTCGSFFTSMDDSLFARGLFRIDVSASKPMDFDYRDIEEKLQELGQSWAERLAYALEATDCDEQRLSELTGTYGEAFPVNYMNAHSAQQALFDIDKIESITKDQPLQLDVYTTDALADNQLRLKLYSASQPIILSDILPILANLGLRAISELPYEIKPEGHAESVWIHDFMLELSAGAGRLDIAKVKAVFEEAFLCVWTNRMESDRLNHLVLSAQMSWRDVVILRCYMKYMRQARAPHSQSYIQDTMTNHPTIARDLVDLFAAYFDPEKQKKSDKQAKALSQSIDEKLTMVDALNEDRVIRIMRGMIEATLRTNFYQKGTDGAAYKDYVSLKLNPKAIAILPDPKPFREIFVYSTTVEGVHLRGDKIARGGLRWSDRHEDFRTEVLGLMKAQMVKNSVIVPMGSKGGFVVKIPTKSREEFLAAGVECYKTFIRGLLDITDNLSGDKVIPPELTVRRDEDDPYLVVAADKGTATFSDIANGLSQDYGFWMDDAFASGGSAGYDHKKMGITARGAWESVKLHFRHMNHDTQSSDFDVIGVGDMGGDVFGNGMLLSKNIRLVGAFNHMHIFCDPNPDSSVTYTERKRLFDEVKGWDAYDTDLLSEGGRIYSRFEKSLTLTPQIKERFDITEDELSPEDLIKKMLQAKVDLLWFGGIGTYIKATKETHADAGDKANDAVRIDAPQLRARVIGEGANLGVTQLGRIEFARAGGRINTDFIDNSGGVDSSDHEVNIKILMSDVIRAPKSEMTIESRNKLLEAMTKNVEDHVLRHNYQQAQAVSLVEAQAEAKLQLHDEFIQDMERLEGLNRSLEFLPDAEEIQKRLAEGSGLSRPELAVLVSYAKISLTKSLLDSKIPDESSMQIWLYDYFPEQLREVYKSFIDGHKLRREIIAMAIANSLINRLGPTFIQATMKKTGMSCDAIVRAYIATREIFDLRALWDDIESYDNRVCADVQIRAMIDTARLSEYAITWLLTRQRDDLDVSSVIATYQGPVRDLMTSWKNLVSDTLKLSINKKIDNLSSQGLSKELSEKIAVLSALKSGLDIVQISQKNKGDLEVIARIYFALGQRFRLDWLQNRAVERPVMDVWDREATEAILDKLYSVQAGLASKILTDLSADDAVKPGAEVESWTRKNKDLLVQVDPFFDKIERAGDMDLAMLMVAEQRLRHLYGG